MTALSNRQMVMTQRFGILWQLWISEYIQDSLQDVLLLQITVGCCHPGYTAERFIMVSEFFPFVCKSGIGYSGANSQVHTVESGVFRTTSTYQQEDTGMGATDFRTREFMQSTILINKQNPAGTPPQETKQIHASIKGERLTFPL